MSEVLLAWPLPLSGLLICGAMVALGIGLSALADAFVRPAARGQEVARGLVPPVGAAMTAGCLVWFGLLANLEMRDIDEASGAVNTEAAAVRSLDTLRRTLDAPASEAIGAALRRYVAVVVRDEWPRMSSQGGSTAARAELDGLRGVVLQRRGPDATEVRAWMQAELHQLEQARLKRLNIAVERIPAVLWFAVTGSAFVILVFSALIHAGHARGAGRVLGGLLGLLLGLQMFTVAVVDRPFVGHVAVSAAPLLQAVGDEAVR